MSKNPEEYILNCLNTSTSKYAYAFAKADRFQRTKRIQTEAKYTLPSTITKRTCTFGFGNKTTLVNDRCSPPPGAYQSLSSFDVDKVQLKSPLFGYGRDKVMFGSYLKEAEKKAEKIPSPNKYNVCSPKDHLGGLIGMRVKTEEDLRKDKTNPGPGSYHLHSIQMANSSSFFLSNFKKSTSPKYQNTSTIDLPSRKKRSSSAFFYQVDQKQFGKSRTSKFRNVVAASFGKSKREGILQKWKLGTPGFKYSSFSEFGRTAK